jgi:hypothetical protein
MDRRRFCQTVFLLPFLAPYLNVSTQTKRGFDLQLISSYPHKLILPILEEFKSSIPFSRKNFAFLNPCPQERELKKALSQDRWSYVSYPSQADLVFNFLHLLKPAPSSFTLLKNDEVRDIRRKNLLSIWKEISGTHQPSSLLTVASFSKKRHRFPLGERASVYIDGMRAESLQLNKSYSKIFRTRRGNIEVVIENEMAKVVNSSCRHKICLNTPPASVEGDRIICAPNHFLLEIESRHSVDTIIG